MKMKAMAGLALLVIGVSGTAHAQLQNGSFEMNTGNGQVGFNTSVTGWTVDPGGYTFLFAPGTADTSGANGQYGNLALWGPGNGVNNGLPATSPDGGYFIGADGAFQDLPIYQTLSGLTVGHTYNVSFYWAASQQEFFTGATQDGWTVSLGSDTQDTGSASIPSQGFSGWQSASFNYVATSTSEVLSFLAHGVPSGVPPFSLLDGVKLSDTTSVPEPTALVSLFAGVVGFGVFARRRTRAKK